MTVLGPGDRFAIVSSALDLVVRALDSTPGELTGTQIEDAATRIDALRRELPLGMKPEPSETGKPGTLRAALAGCEAKFALDSAGKALALCLGADSRSPETAAELAGIQAAAIRYAAINLLRAQSSLLEAGSFSGSAAPASLPVHRAEVADRRDEMAADGPGRDMLLEEVALRRARLRYFATKCLAQAAEISRMADRLTLLGEMPPAMAVHEDEVDRMLLEGRLASFRALLPSERPEDDQDRTTDVVRLRQLMRSRERAAAMGLALMIIAEELALRRAAMAGGLVGRALGELRGLAPRNRSRTIDEAERRSRFASLGRIVRLASAAVANSAADASLGENACSRLL